MPRLEEWEIKKYWEIFQGLKPENNKLTGDRVSPVLKNSRLKDDQLSKIWDLSDIDADGRLDFEEFCITMRLIFDLVNGSMLEVPLELPGWLIPSSKAHLIHANRAVATGSTGNSSFEGDDDDNLSDDLTGIYLLRIRARTRPYTIPIAIHTDVYGSILSKDCIRRLQKCHARIYRQHGT